MRTSSTHLINETSGNASAHGRSAATATATAEMCPFRAECAQTAARGYPAGSGNAPSDAGGVTRATATEAGPEPGHTSVCPNSTRSRRSSVAASDSHGGTRPNVGTRQCRASW
jgi:hypothetical protein